MFPKALRGYKHHGVTFHETELHGNQYLGFCPTCRREKFYVSEDGELWDCKTCAESGNFYQFLEWRMQRHRKHLKGGAILKLSKKKLLKPATFRAWGMGYYPRTEEYMIPETANQHNKLTNIGRYKRGSNNTHATANAEHSLCQPTEQTQTDTVWIMEGQWDGMALWECLDGSETVYAKPGSNTFPKQSLILFKDKDVIIVGDHDDPGRKGAAKTGDVLNNIARSIQYVHWPEENDVGYDFRQLYIDCNRKKAHTLNILKQRIKDEPPIKEEEKKKVPPRQDRIIQGTGKGIPPKEVWKEFSKHLFLCDDKCLEVLFGSAFANRMKSDPLWLFFVGPPGSAKTELVMSLSGAQGSFKVSTLTSKALVSGHNARGDSSWLPLMDGKLVLIKDWTSILSKPEAERFEIYGALREIFDGHYAKLFGMGDKREYNSKFGLLAAVTHAIEHDAKQNATLGERFLRFNMIDHKARDSRREICRRALLSITHESKMREHLKQVSAEVLSYNGVEPPKISDSDEQYLIDLAIWLSQIRTPVTRNPYRLENIHFTSKPEVGTRPVKQLAILAMGIAQYKREKVITRETLNTVTRVAIDSAPSDYASIISALYILTQLRDETYIDKSILDDVSITDKFPFKLEDLELLGMVHRKRQSRNSYYALDKEMLNIMQRCRMFQEDIKRARQVHSKEALIRNTLGRKIRQATT